MISLYYPNIARKLQQLQITQNLLLLEVDAADIQTMHQLILKFQLRPRDALQTAAMQKVRCFNLISNDEDFDRDPDIKRFTLP